jgi:hypothetical protein
MTQKCHRILFTAEKDVGTAWNRNTAQMELVLASSLPGFIRDPGGFLRRPGRKESGMIWIG